jgi:hypothetical protein
MTLGFQVVGHGPRSDLIITPLDLQYFGRYTCKAVNPHGEAFFEIDLKEAREPSFVQQVNRWRQYYNNYFARLSAIFVEKNGRFSATSGKTTMAFFYKILDLIPAQTAVILSQNCLFLQHFCFNFSFFYLAIQMYIYIF